jgi:OOP family OmpA-OmpF porin
LYGGQFQINTDMFLDAEFSVLYTKTPYINIVHFPQDTDIFRYTVNGIHIFDSDSIITPIIKVGIGFEEVDINAAGNRDSVFVDAGLGVQVLLSDSISLKAETVYMLKYNDNRKDNNIAFLAGITYSFGAKSQERDRIVKLLKSIDEHYTDQSFEATNTEDYQEEYDKSENSIVQAIEDTNTDDYQEKYTEDDNINFPIVQATKDAETTDDYQEEKGNDKIINSVEEPVSTPTYNIPNHKDYIQVVNTHVKFKNLYFCSSSCI